jgi:hypothetical protein
MYLLVATIFPVSSPKRWFRIQVKNNATDFRNRNHGEYKKLPGGAIPFIPGERPWDYFPEFGGLLFKAMAGDPNNRANQVMVFLHVPWNFLDLCSSTTCKGQGEFGDAAGGVLGPSREFVWVMGPGLAVPTPAPVPPPVVAAGTTTSRARGSVRVTKAPRPPFICPYRICPDPDVTNPGRTTEGGALREAN